MKKKIQRPADAGLAKRVGQILLLARTAKKLTGAQLAAKSGEIGLTKTTISSYEVGRTLISLPRLTRLLAVCDQTVPEEIRLAYDPVAVATNNGMIAPGASRRVIAEEFIRVWQTSATKDEAAAKLGMSVKQVHLKSCYFRKNGVLLKTMPRKVTVHDWAALRKLAEDLAPKDPE